MAKDDQAAISLIHVLILSLALNTALLVRLLPSSTSEVVKQGNFPSHAVKASTRSSNEDDGQRVINLDHGDPVMYEEFWERTGEETAVLIPGSQSISYFSDTGSLCWFLEAQLADVIRRLHGVVGNAVVDRRHVVVGTGSSQLILAALYAISMDLPQPVSVISAAPFYSSYQSMTEFLKSGLYKWEGDARRFEKDGPYIELVTSPNNPDGSLRVPAANGTGVGAWIHDLAYYWPQYTPIASSADHDVMLFTVSKATGHAGSRIGWALVKDEAVARKMVKFIELNTIGVSKDSQLRAARILEAVADGVKADERFFEYGFYAMRERWERLRAAVRRSGRFSLPEFSTGVCNYSGRVFSVQPAFAWVECVREDDDDCGELLRRHRILTRSGLHFGVSSRFLRLSMLDRTKNYELFLERLSMIS